MKIVLTGFMGTGKTSVGKELSRRLGYQFVDTDALIEEREKMPISLIFKEKGEKYFRTVERAVVEEVSHKINVVVATGGGVIKNKDNVNDLRRKGIIIWLKAEPGTILKRVMLEEGKRPLLDVADPINEIKKLLFEREEFYMQSDISINTDFITAEETAGEIIKKAGIDMQSVRVELKERSYEILIGKKVLQKLGLNLIGFRPSRVAVVSNKTVFPIYKGIILKSMNEAGITPEIFLIPDGEGYKDLLWASFLYGELLKAHFDRDSLLIAFGGGVVGDITGFVASTYMRGIKYIQAPTTLLAQVDSSVGGKTGVNHELGKNMIGTFYQPSLVFIDIETLKTLPQREFSAGAAEIIKYGVIADRELFDSLGKNIKDIFSFGDSLLDIIKRSCKIKADIVSKDEKEAGLRAVLNFGHTIGHALETATGYKRFIHGEAIAIGMCAAADLAVRIGIFKKQDAESIKSLIELYKLPAKIPQGINISEILNAMEVDKKFKAGQMRFILPESIGKVRIEDNVDREIVKEILR
jgi:3-dehydroquinate synthase